MVKNIELEKILEQNPHIDQELLKQAMELVQKLADIGGTKRSHYNLISPYARRRISASDTTQSNSQIAHVRRHSRIWSNH